MKNKKPILYSLAVLAFLAATLAIYRSNLDHHLDGTLPPEPPVISTNPTSAVQLQLAPVEDSQAVMEAIGWSIARTAIREGDTKDRGEVSYLALVAVSTGEFDKLDILNHPVDVVYTYLPTKSGVIRLPVAIGFQNDGLYLSLDGSSLGETRRAAFLAKSQQQLQKGQTFGISVLRASYNAGVDRSDCETGDLPAWCVLAKEYNRDFRDAERLFLSKIIIDSSWMPVGWIYFLYPPGPYSQIVQLP